MEDSEMPREPAMKRACAFVDGQNLFHAAREAFGYTYPNYDIKKLAKAICDAHGWQLMDVYFYTGFPAAQDDEFWNAFWQNKLRAMSRGGIHTFSRPLRYRNQRFTLPDGSLYIALVGQEKGVDVRISLDVIRGAIGNEYDVALLFSQDQDLSEVADEIRAIAAERERWIKIASAFPVSPTTRNSRGINRTDWIKIGRTEYEECIDQRDYRGKTS
jgi:uncharacterized LabA/DUF88 family protein